MSSTSKLRGSSLRSWRGFAAALAAGMVFLLGGMAQANAAAAPGGTVIRSIATGTYVLWYPQLHRLETRRLPDQLKALGAKSWLHVALTVRKPTADGFGMHGSGLFILNPPWVLAQQLAEAMPALVELLGEDESAGYTLEHDGL